MRQRTSSEESKPVGLFPFLAVLLCTMGALLVLLVVLAQRVGERVLSQQSESPEVSEPLQNREPRQDAPPLQEQENDAEVVALAQQLEEVHDYQKQLRKLREQAESRLQEEQLRLSHLEEHARRIEHEMARLAIAAKQLEATENLQSVDQQQAESELARLNDLIKETEEQLEELREAASGQRSYAIVPYKGPNGTFRQPIYIECSKEGVIIRPEGIRFISADFAAPNWAGNPLAAALRASREYLNAKAAQAGEPEPPDPYPLLIVRPDGIAQYQLARTALASWDADFGYEFVDRDWKLEYPDLPDPRLAQLQHHAQLNAREQLIHLIRSAPRQYHGIGLGGGSSMAAGGASGSNGYGGEGQSDDPNEFGALAQSADGLSSGTGGSADGQSFAAAGTATGDFQHGALAGDTEGTGNLGQGNGSQDRGSQNNEASSFAGADSSQSSGGAEGSNEGLGSNEAVGSNETGGGEFAQGGAQNSAAGASSGSLAQSGGQPATGSSASGAGSDSSSGSSGSGGSPSGGPPSGATATANSLNVSNQRVQSIAETRGKNWAVSRGARGAVPIRRPIHVVVRNDRLTLTPSRHASDGVEATGSVIYLNQSARQISDQFVEALRTRVEQWGLAGNGLYWRPVLEINVGPEAEGTARGLTRLLHNSGVEVSLKKTAIRR